MDLEEAEKVAEFAAVRGVHFSEERFLSLLSEKARAAFELMQPQSVKPPVDSSVSGIRLISIESVLPATNKSMTFEESIDMHRDKLKQEYRNIDKNIHHSSSSGQSKETPINIDKEEEKKYPTNYSIYASDLGSVCRETDATTRRMKSSDSQLKYYALNRPQYKMAHCNSRFCRYGGGCVGKATNDQMKEMRDDFWGPAEDSSSAPATALRRELIIAILRAAYRPGKEGAEKYEFHVGQRSNNNTLVCEAAFLSLLGLSNSVNASDAPTQWINAKKFVELGVGAGKYSLSLLNSDLELKGEGNCSKLTHAISFIQHFAETYGDKIPTSSGGEDVFVVPFAFVNAFHQEYQSWCEHAMVEPDKYASISTFQRAYSTLESKIRLLKAKGSFNTCEICNSAAELIQNKHKILFQAQREVIQKFRQLHLSQQSLERQYLDSRKLKAQQCDELGNPIRLLLFADGMTQYTCRTPRFGKESKTDKFIESRIVGVEVYCGPIKTVFVYRTDATIGGGANIMIEIMRQAMIDLCGLLRDKGLATPKVLWYQFDNCGENKNKEMLAYCSLLIESFRFDEVEIAFLIVGHTHASIDQYFSVISKAIDKCPFIGSPLALLELIRRAHISSWVQTPIIRDITVYFDVKSALAPYINKKLKFYQVPHNIIFKPSFGRKAVMQYKMFSNNPHYLPLPPEGVIASFDAMELNSIDSVALPSSLAVVNGQQAVLRHLGWKGNSSGSDVMAEDNVLSDRRDLTSLTKLDSVIEDLEKLSTDAVARQELRMEAEAEGLQYSKEFNVKLQREMHKLSTADRGYIMCIDISGKKQADLPPIDGIKPTPYDTAPLLAQLAASDENDVDDDVDDGETAIPNGKDAEGTGVAVSSRAHRQSDSSAGAADSQQKKVLNAAKSIKSTSTWVINMLGSRLRLSDHADFGDRPFEVNTLTGVERDWYAARSTVAGVLQIAADEYAVAAPWSPLPLTSLSEVDLLSLQQAQQIHMEGVRKATALAEKLLVRPGHNAGVMQQVVEYGHKNSYITDAVRQKRSRETVAGTGTDTAPTKKTSSAKWMCDVSECSEVAAAANLQCSMRGCKTRHYCAALHLSHDNHGPQEKRQHRLKWSAYKALPAVTAAAETVKHKNDTIPEGGDDSSSGDESGDNVTVEHTEDGQGTTAEPTPTTDEQTGVNGPPVLSEEFRTANKSAAKLYDKILGSVTAEQRKAKGRNYMVRLAADLDYPVYFNDLWLLQEHVLGVDMEFIGEATFRKSEPRRSFLLDYFEEFMSKYFPQLK